MRSRPGSCRRIRSCRRASSAEGSIPSSSARISRARWKAFERVGLTSVAVQSEHQQHPEALPQRDAARPAFRVRRSPLRRRRRRADASIAVFLRLEPKLVEPGSLCEQGRAGRRGRRAPGRATSPARRRGSRSRPSGRPAKPSSRRARGSRTGWRRVRTGRATGRSRAVGPAGDRRRASCAGSRRTSAGCFAPARVVRRPRASSISVSAGTTWFARTRRFASTARCFGPPRGIGPSPASTSSGPRTRNCTRRP